jgi:hypothetical protein
VLQQYFMLTFTYNLRNFGKAVSNSNFRNQDDHGDRPRMFPGGQPGGFPRPNF